MSRKDREDWQAQLDADPALRAAWDNFGSILARVSGALPDAPNRTRREIEQDLDELREAALRVHAEAGEDIPRN